MQFLMLEDGEKIIIGDNISIRVLAPPDDNGQIQFEIDTPTDTDITLPDTKNIAGGGPSS